MPQKEAKWPGKDFIHDAVKNALIKWTITADPFRIHYEDVDVYADWRVEKRDNATGGRRALVIEIKGFVGASAVHALEVALGQYALYLAVSDTVYSDLFMRKSFQLIVQTPQIALLIVNLSREEIVTWIN